MRRRSETWQALAWQLSGIWALFLAQQKRKKKNEKEKGKAEDKEKGKDNGKQGASHTLAAFRGGRKTRAGRRQCSMDRNQWETG